MNFAQAKPEPGDPDVEIRALPNSHYSIRFWPGGLGGDDDGCCLDFLENGIPINTPPGYTITCYPRPNERCQDAYQLKSAEEYMELVSVPQGTEKFVLCRTCSIVSTVPTNAALLSSRRDTPPPRTGR